MFYSRRNILKIRDFWFVDGRDINDEKKVDFVQYHDLLKPLANKKNIIEEKKSKTIINDLTSEMESIVDNFKKNTKYEIRRAEKDGCTCEFLWSNDLQKNNSILKTIDLEHKKMFKQKGHAYKSEFNNMNSAVKANMLCVSIAYLPDKTACAYHVYIVGNSTARLLHSISVFRSVDASAEKAAIGRANRFLHFKDMDILKKNGFARYDWGGYSETKDQISISEFKASFGGQIIDTYRYIFATSYLGKSLAKIVKLRIK